MISPSRLKPASQKEGNSELLSCLILVAAASMTAEDRDAWLRAAKMTLSGIPADLLAKGCRKARETCRFASEIVPTIIAATKVEWDRRLRWEAEDRARRENMNAPRLAKPEYVEASELAKLAAMLLRK